MWSWKFGSGESEGAELFFSVSLDLVAPISRECHEVTFVILSSLLLTALPLIFSLQPYFVFDRPFHVKHKPKAPVWLHVTWFASGRMGPRAGGTCRSCPCHCPYVNMKRTTFEHMVDRLGYIEG